MVDSFMLESTNHTPPSQAPGIANCTIPSKKTWTAPFGLKATNISTNQNIMYEQEPKLQTK